MSSSYLPAKLPWKYEGNRFAIVYSTKEVISATSVYEWKDVRAHWLTFVPFKRCYLVRTSWPYPVDVRDSHFGMNPTYVVSEVIAVKEGSG